MPGPEMRPEGIRPEPEKKESEVLPENQEIVERSSAIYQRIRDLEQHLQPEEELTGITFYPEGVGVSDRYILAINRKANCVDLWYWPVFRGKRGLYFREYARLGINAKSFTYRNDEADPPIRVKYNLNRDSLEGERLRRGIPLFKETDWAPSREAKLIALRSLDRLLEKLESIKKIDITVTRRLMLSQEGGKMPEVETGPEPEEKLSEADRVYRAVRDPYVSTVEKAKKFYSRKGDPWLEKRAEKFARKGEYIHTLECLEASSLSQARKNEILALAFERSAEITEAAVRRGAEADRRLKDASEKKWREGIHKVALEQAGIERKKARILRGETEATK